MYNFMLIFARNVFFIVVANYAFFIVGNLFIFMQILVGDNISIFICQFTRI